MDIAEKILKSIVKNTDSVKLHSTWGFYIETPFEAIQMIGLIDHGAHYKLCLYFGDTQRQSRAFYSIKPNIELLSITDWELRPNFHLQSSFGKNLIWFGSDINNQEYINFWINNKYLLHQHPIKQMDNLVNLLVDKEVISLNDEKRNDLEFYLKRYSVFNICAGFALEYSISKKDLAVLNDEGKLKHLLISKINEGLLLIGKSGIEFLKTDNHYDNSAIEECGDPDGL